MPGTWDYSGRRRNVGRPPLSKDTVELILRIACESPTWGYDRIRAELANLGHCISDTTDANILKAQAIERAPNRKRQPTWKAFLQAHWDVLASADFTTTEVWTRGGLVTYYLLFVMELATRHIQKCLEKAGLRQIRFHELRHTFGSLLLQNGESLTYVKEQLGHSSIKTTVDIYGHLAPGANRQAVNRLPALDSFQAAEQKVKKG